MQAQLELFDVPQAEDTGLAHCVCGMNFRGATCPHCYRERWQAAAAIREVSVKDVATTIGGGCGARGRRQARCEVCGTAKPLEARLGPDLPAWYCQTIGKNEWRWFCPDCPRSVV